MGLAVRPWPRCDAWLAGALCTLRRRRPNHPCSQPRQCDL